jgi:DNA-binding SARP family transcriptional activator
MNTPIPRPHIYLFGKYEVKWADQILTSLEAGKAQELFCYLLLYREHPHSREALADLLWGDRFNAQVKKCFRQTLWRLQTNLKAQPELRNCCLLLVEPDWIQLNPAADLWLDVAEFEIAFEAMQGIPAEALKSRHFQTLAGAVALYRGDLLEGWYQDWCLVERERFLEMYLALLDKLMAYCELNQEYQAGLAFGARILSYDRASEHTHRRLMRLHYLAGYRIKALRQFERCTAILDQELGVKPSRHTLALYEQIKADHLDEPTPVTTKPQGASAAELLHQFK